MSGVWNETEPNGGDSLTDSAAMNAQYTGGDLAWIMFAASIVWIMIPGIGYDHHLYELILDFSMQDWRDGKARWHLFGKV
jgi:hypothetical protein